MKGIALLVNNGNYIMEAAEGEVPHYAAKVFCQGDGNERRTPAEAEQVAHKFAQAVNEIDDLRAQRDALVGACEAAKNALSSAQWEYVSQGIKLPGFKASALVRAEVRCAEVLALVRGEDAQ